MSNERQINLAVAMIPLVAIVACFQAMGNSEIPSDGIHSNDTGTKTDQFLANWAQSVSMWQSFETLVVAESLGDRSTDRLRSIDIFSDATRAALRRECHVWSRKPGQVRFDTTGKVETVAIWDRGRSYVSAKEMGEFTLRDTDRGGAQNIEQDPSFVMVVAPVLRFDTFYVLLAHIADDPLASLVKRGYSFAPLVRLDVIGSNYEQIVMWRADKLPSVSVLVFEESPKPVLRKILHISTGMGFESSDDAIAHCLESIQKSEGVAYAIFSGWNVDKDIPDAIFKISPSQSARQVLYLSPTF